MNQTTGAAHERGPTAWVRDRDGGESLFRQDLQWHGDEPVAVSSRRTADLGRVLFTALLALAVVGIVMMNGPADAGPVRRSSSALPAPVVDAEPAAAAVRGAR